MSEKVIPLLFLYQLDRLSTKALISLQNHASRSRKQITSVNIPKGERLEHGLYQVDKEELSLVLDKRFKNRDA